MNEQRILSRSGIYKMNVERRIKNEKIRIDDAQVKAFFDSRVKKRLPYMINYTNYQDQHPELAVQRDVYEKSIIMPLLSLTDNSRVLDIGCGVGRWAKHIFNEHVTNRQYTGVDYSAGLLRLAEQNCCEYKNCMFFEGAFQNIMEILPALDIRERYDVIFVNGVMMYINDEDIMLCVNNMKKLLAKHGRICLKETVGISERLTLNKVYSDELTSQYSAIYRSIEEYDALLKEYFLQDGYDIVQKDVMWRDDLTNRKETTAYYWIIERMQ